MDRWPPRQRHGLAAGARPAPAGSARLGAEVAAARRSAPPLSTYTAVLIANTAVPIWHEARHELPFVFAAGAAASAGGAATIAARPPTPAPARRLGVAAAWPSWGRRCSMERRLGELAEPYAWRRAATAGSPAG